MDKWALVISGEAKYSTTSNAGSKSSKIVCLLAEPSDQLSETPLRGMKALLVIRFASCAFIKPMHLQRFGGTVSSEPSSEN